MSLDIFGAITGLFVIVYDGQHALRYTLGRARSVVGPGIHFKWPLIQTFKVEETKHTTLDLEPQVIQLDDNLVYEVDCKVVYQIVNLRKAIIEVDNLVTGLQNRVVIAVQKIVSRRTRDTVTDVDGMCTAIREELRSVEDQWGVRILEFGFSNISPSPTTLEITQLELLTREKLSLFRRLKSEGLADEAAVALVSGAVVSVHPDEDAPSRRRESVADAALVDELERDLDEASRAELRKKRAAARPGGEKPVTGDPGTAAPDPFGDASDDPLGGSGGPSGSGPKR
jgi:regulator of protease activity HflC (stomatin/prohibitin superfamily)